MNLRAAVGGAVVALVVLPCLLASVLTGNDPNRQVDPAVSKLLPPGSVLFQIEVAGRPAPLLAQRIEWQGDRLLLWHDGIERSLERASVLNPTPGGVADRRHFVLGSDQFGRDLWSRLLYGGRISLFVALFAGALSITIGVLIGALRALGPPWLDAALGRLTDTLLAFPDLVLVLLLAALFRPSLGLLIALVGTTSWMGLSRIVRGELESLVKRDWILAARALGQSEARIFWRHLLPHLSGPLLADASMRLGAILLLEAALSFLGFGVQPPNASWGTLIADGRAHMVTAWWISAFPGIAITTTVLGLFLLAEGVDAELSPRRRMSRARLPMAREGRATS